MYYSKHNSYRLILALLLMMASIYANADKPDLKFRRLDTRNGLSNSQVNCILKDSKGFVWIGTQYGLNRYDGYRFREFHSNIKDSTALLSDYVDNLFEDVDGRIWVQQELKYCVYDPKTEQFEQNLSPWLKKAGAEGAVEKVYIDKRKNYWIKLWGGKLYYYNPSKNIKSSFVVDDAKYGPNSGLSSFDSYGKHTVMILKNGVIAALDGDKGKVVWVSNYVKQRQTADVVNNSIYIDHDRNYWVMTDGDCYVYMQKTRKWYNGVNHLLRKLGFADVPKVEMVTSAMEDRNGHMFLGTNHSGLFVLDFVKKRIYQYEKDINNETSFSDINVVCLYLDRSGQMWIGTYMGGVNQVVFGNTYVSNLKTGSVNTVTEDKDGNYWLGTNESGIYRYNPITGESRHFTAADGLTSNILVASLCASDGTLWFGTYGGGLLHYANGRFTAMRKGTIGDDNVWAVVEAPDKNIWIGTLGAGVQCINPETGTVDTYNSKNSRIASDYVSSMQMTSEGWIVVGTSNNYSLIDPKTRKVVNMKLDQDSTRMTVVTSSNTQVFSDSRGLIWYCSAAGVHVLDNATGRVTLLDQTTGLAGNAVYSVVEDNNKNIWVATEYGVSLILLKYDDGQWQMDIRNYNNRDGLLPGPYNQRSSFLTHDGKILVGVTNGLNIIKPDQLGSRKVVGRPLFSGLMLYGQQVEVGKKYNGRVILPEALNEIRHMTLSYKENMFTIQMASDQGLINNRSQYVYRLEGFSDKWMKTEIGNPNISFAGLAPGTYKLVVKLLDDCNQIGAEESCMEIVINPPFWRTWWAYLIYIMLAGVLLWMLHRREVKKLRLEKIKMVAETEKRKRREAASAYDNMSDNLRHSFDDIFSRLDSLMSSEDNEERYEQQQEVFSMVESLMSDVNEKNTQPAEEKQGFIRPTISDMQIVSLDQRLVNSATEYVESNLSNSDISVETMSEALNMSRVHLYKRLTAITGQTPSEFIRDIRLRHAEQLILKSQLSISEISYKVGFNNPRYFTKYFKDKYGVIPSQYKKNEE